MKKFAFFMCLILIFIIVFFGFKIVDMKSQIKLVKKDIEELKKDNYNLYLEVEKKNSMQSVDSYIKDEYSEDELEDLGDSDLFIIKEVDSDNENSKNNRRDNE